MELQKVESIVPLRFQLRPYEQSLTPRYFDWVMGSWILLLVCGPIVVLHLMLAFGIGLAFITSILTFAVTTYLGVSWESNKLYLPSSVVGFFKTNKARLESIDTEIEDFNRLLRCQQNGQLLLVAGTQNDDADLVEFWDKRRELLQGQVDSLVADLRVAASNDFLRIENRSRRNIRLLRKEFEKKVLQLQQLEHNLNKLNTPDISPYKTAVRLRRQLEQEQQRLETISGKKLLLPPRRKQVRLLKA